MKKRITKFHRKVGSRLILLLGAALVFAQVASQADAERIVRIHNASGGEVRDLEVRWQGGKAGWVRLAPATIVQVKARIPGPTRAQVSYTDNQGIPRASRAEQDWDPGTKNVLELRLMPDGAVYWPSPSADNR